MLLRKTLLWGAARGASTTALRRPVALSQASLARWQPPPANFDSQFGDYPQLPWTPFDKRDPRGKWDDPVHRRNFGEPIHEEFDVQDAFFQGDHEPAKNLLQGLRGQVAVFTIFAAFLVAAWLTDHEKTKPPARVLPEEVQHYLATAGWEKVKPRPYDAPKSFPYVTMVPAPILPPPSAHEDHHGH